MLLDSKSIQTPSMPDDLKLKIKSARLDIHATKNDPKSWDIQSTLDINSPYFLLKTAENEYTLAAQRLAAKNLTFNSEGYGRYFQKHPHC